VVGRVGAHGHNSEGMRTHLDAGDALANRGRCCHATVRCSGNQSCRYHRTLSTVVIHEPTVFNIGKELELARLTQRVLGDLCGRANGDCRVHRPDIATRASRGGIQLLSMDDAMVALSHQEWAEIETRLLETMGEPDRREVGRWCIQERYAR
jgi:hypothetical protein